MELATPGQRLKGAVVDSLLALVPSFLLARPHEDPSRTLAGIALFVILFAVQIRLLARDGQTVGKRFAKTRIVRADTGENGGFTTNVLMRAVVGALPNALPLYFLVDSLFVFRADRRCLHDFIAGTSVVRVEAADALSSAA